MSTLRDQIIGQYLRNLESRHGILLLCSRPDATPKNKTQQATRKRWEIKGARQDFAVLVASLRSEAAKLVTAMDEIDRLDVVGIDYH
jgi:hypothetical protein